MRYGVTLPNIGVEATELVELAVEAEAAGWDGVFVWDCVFIAHGANEGPEKMLTCDPWIALAAMAARTQRVKLGTMVTPLSRRRPWKLARETVTLDRLSGGRFILPVGLGAIDDGGFSKVGEELDRKVRAELLDESLDILAGLWSGQPFSYTGKHYQVGEMTFLPTSAQTSHVPVWVVGAWPRMKSMRRTIRWDGVLPAKMTAEGASGDMEPDDLRALGAYITEQRPQVAGSDAASAFDIVMEGETPGDDGDRAAAIIRPLAEAGLTWWLEGVWQAPAAQGGLAGMRERIRQGPPRA
ncbi:MAG TPA: LLM class flavin-dependent oxidoreductase [Ktedonobacterales bacterium]|nr:LLM class flavin-dependent oxidoreductase [Ktedonobacterales bacterium]HUY78652.1 LLM class flavin-dependent oxidoreductase [Ktedonobacterales bacterium]